MGGVHELAKTTTWPAAWGRLRRQVYLRQRRHRAGEWDYRLQTLASRTAADPWAAAFARLLNNIRAHRAAAGEWPKALEALRRAAANREARRS